MTPTDAPAASRPPILEKPPAEAAPHVAPGAPCPACGEALDPFEVRTGLDLLFPGPGARCKRCDLLVPVAHRPVALVLRMLGLLVLGLVGIAVLAVVAGQKAPRLSPMVVFDILALPWGLWVFVEARRRLQRVAGEIAQARKRWETKQEEKGIQVDGAALLRSAKPGATCPVCEKANLEGSEPNALWSRGALSCPRCRLELPVAPTPTGMTLGFAVAAVLVIAGALILNGARAYQVQPGNAFLIRSAFGALLALGGLYVGFILQGADDKAAARELEARRRSKERRKLGLPVKDEDDEPAVWFQENLEAVIVAVILALVIRHFVMEAFVIPTGSMAPTLYGDHYEVVCKKCNYPFAFSKKENDYDDRRMQRLSPLCPLCGSDDINREERPYDAATGGNKILVNKFAYSFTKPERWQVIVFKFPKEPTKKNFIKRLLALPGERIYVDGRGDVWIAKDHSLESPFVQVRKPPLVQEELWMPAYDSRYVTKDSWWTPEDDAARWQDVRDAKGETQVAKAGTGETWLRYGERRPVKDLYGYNSNGTGGRHNVGDLRVRATVTPAANAKAVGLGLIDNSRVLQVLLPVGSGDAAVVSSKDTAGTVELAKVKVPALVPGKAADVALSYADRELALFVDGVELGRWHDDGAPPVTSSSGVRLGAVDGEVRFENVKIDRDIFYTHDGGSYNPTREEDGKGLEIPEDSYFCLGDNSPNSQDGRSWGFVREPHLIGRAFLVFWPLWHVKLIR